MEVKTDIGHQITARKLMELMLYDNGCVYREGGSSDKLSRYPKKHFDAITKACDTFFTNHPEFLTDEDLENITTGEHGEVQDKYGAYPEYKALDEALFEYFEVM